MSIDRNPKERKDLRLQSAQGKIMMPEESLIWIPATIIHKLEGKVDEETLKKAIKLKEISNLEYFGLLGRGSSALILISLVVITFENLSIIINYLVCI
jgi:hypothetical protein